MTVCPIFGSAEVDGNGIFFKLGGTSGHFTTLSSILQSQIRRMIGNHLLMYHCFRCTITVAITHNYCLQSCSTNHGTEKTSTNDPAQMIGSIFMQSNQLKVLVNLVETSLTTHQILMWLIKF